MVLILRTLKLPIWKVTNGASAGTRVFFMNWIKITVGAWHIVQKLKSTSKGITKVPLTQIWTIFWVAWAYRMARWVQHKMAPWRSTCLRCGRFLVITVLRRSGQFTTAWPIPVGASSRSWKRKAIVARLCSIKMKDSVTHIVSRWAQPTITIKTGPSVPVSPMTIAQFRQINVLFPFLTRIACG